MKEENQLLIGEWTVLPRADSISDGRQTKHLDKKVMQLFMYLTEHRDRIVSREELLDNLWKDQVVADDVLNVAVSSLRKAVGDDFKSPRYIKTIARKGYQLIAEVSEVSKPEKPEGKPIIRFFLASIVLLGCGLLWFLQTEQSKEGGEQELRSGKVRLAVLPFDYFSSIKNKEYISDGLTEAVINRLVQEPNLLVTSRTSVMQFKTQKLDVKDVASRLNVEWILEGSVQLEGDRIQVTAQLINGITDQHLWSESYQRKMSDLFEIQSELATEIVRKLSREYQPGSVLISNIDIPPAAFDAFLKARFYSNEGKTREAKEHYQKAIALYPQYAEAFAGLALSYFLDAYGDEKNAARYVDKGSELAINAAAIDSQPASVQLVLALRHFYQQKDFDAAGKAFNLAFETNHQDLMILEWYMQYLFTTRQFSIGQKMVNHMMTVSPLAYNKTTAQQLYYYQGNYLKAEEEIENKSDLISAAFRESLYTWLSLAKGDNKMFAKHGPLFLQEFGVELDKVESFRKKLAEEGQGEALLLLIDYISAMSDYDRAELYAWSGQNKKAISLLEGLVNSGSLNVLKIDVEPSFQSLKPLPEFQKLVARLKLDSIE